MRCQKEIKEQEKGDQASSIHHQRPYEENAH